MGRKKIVMKFIDDDRKRASTFEKRRIGLFKKASELNRLCGVNITVIIVNKELAYKFSDSTDSYFKNCLSEKKEKFEEDFNNESLSEFINKKSLKNSNTNDSNSNEHHTFEDEQNISLSDDDEDSKFINVLVDYDLLDKYKNIIPDISPIKENLDIVQIDQSGSAKVNNSSNLTSFNFATNNQNNNQLITKGSIPSINEITMNFGSSRSEVANARPDCISYRELVSMSTTNASYQFNIENSINSTSNSNWQSYRTQNFPNTHLLVDINGKCQNPVNYLETPTYEMCSNIGIQHLNNNMSYNYHDEDESPPSKKIKQFYDSTDTFRQHPFP